MKISGCIELTLRLYNVIFLTSGVEVGNWNCPENPTIIQESVWIPKNQFANVSVSEKSEISGKLLHGIMVWFLGKFLIPVLRSRPEVENMTLHSFRVNSIYPQSFIQIGLRVFEILQRHT